MPFAAQFLLCFLLFCSSCLTLGQLLLPPSADVVTGGSYQLPIKGVPSVRKENKTKLSAGGAHTDKLERTKLRLIHLTPVRDSGWWLVSHRHYWVTGSTFRKRAVHVQTGWKTYKSTMDEWLSYKDAQCMWCRCRVIVPVGKSVFQGSQKGKHCEVKFCT